MRKSMFKNLFIAALTCLGMAVTVMAQSELTEAEESAVAPVIPETIALPDGMTETEYYTLQSMANSIYRHYTKDQYVDNVTLTAEDADTELKAFILYWYQYNHSDDARINTVEEYNEISEASLNEMMTELWGSCTDEDLKEYYSKYVDRIENELSYSYATGDFGDAGMAVFMFSTASFEDEYAVLNGNVWVYDMDSYEYAPQGEFEVKFLKESANDNGIHTFVELTVGSKAD